MRNLFLLCLPENLALSKHALQLGKIKLWTKLSAIEFSDWSGPTNSPLCARVSFWWKHRIWPNQLCFFPLTKSQFVLLELQILYPLAKKRETCGSPAWFVIASQVRHTGQGYSCSDHLLPLLVVTWSGWQAPLGLHHAPGSTLFFSVVSTTSATVYNLVHTSLVSRVRMSL